MEKNDLVEIKIKGGIRERKEKCVVPGELVGRG